MTEIEQLKEGLKDLTIKNAEKCLECIELAIDKKVKIINNQLRLFKQQLSTLKNHQTRGTLTPKEIDTEMSVLSMRLMTFIDEELEDAMIINTNVLIDKTQKEIIIVSKPEQEGTMREFFAKHYFPKVSFKLYGDTLPEKFEGIIVIEDMATGSTSEGKMAQYLKKSYPYFLYFGSGQFPKNLQDEYDKGRNRVYFANSPFSLYARLKELLDYIKYYGK
jgi:hypothetical protein